MTSSLFTNVVPL